MRLTHSAAVLDTHQHLPAAVNDATRKIPIPRGTHAAIPLKFDEDGFPVTPATPPTKLVIKRLSLRDLEFLRVWRECAWNLEKTRQRVKLDDQRFRILIKRLRCFRDEDAKVKALAEIPTQAWITAKHVENVYNGGNLEDSEHKSLVELAKIEGAYKTQNGSSQNLTLNVFNLPKLSPEAAQKLKAIADQEALIIQEGQVVS